MKAPSYLWILCFAPLLSHKHRQGYGLILALVAQVALVAIEPFLECLSVSFPCLCFVDHGFVKTDRYTSTRGCWVVLQTRREDFLIVGLNNGGQLSFVLHGISLHFIHCSNCSALKHVKRATPCVLSAQLGKYF